MTRLLLERLDPPTTIRGTRACETAEAWADEELAGRTVWCAGARPGGRAGALALHLRPISLPADPVAAAARLEAGVRPGDVVIVDDDLAAQLAEAVRAQGAHAVAHLRVRAQAQAGQRAAARIDAYIMSWPLRTGPHRAHVERVAAALPHAGVVAAAEFPAGTEGQSVRELAWRSVLADLVHGDRDERVGGTVGARPAVPVR
jgi:hypothetical protein